MARKNDQLPCPLENCERRFADKYSLDDVDDFHYKICHHCSVCKIHVGYRSAISKHFKSTKCGGKRVKSRPAEAIINENAGGTPAEGAAATDESEGKLCIQFVY